MIHRDVIIIGGGPAGSSCAWRLRQHGIDSLVLDKATFPREKLCAGWITPGVVADLSMDLDDYPHRLLTFAVTHVHMLGLSYPMRSPQHSIRRFEFDAWLLQRSGAPVARHRAKRIERRNGHYVIDEQYECDYLVGAGGTACPVYQGLFRSAQPRAKVLQAVALEQEFPYEWRDPDCHLWFFERGLPGYSWYVPKQNGYLNLGVGAMAERLKARNDGIRAHWDPFVHRLSEQGLIAETVDLSPKGYSYFVREKVTNARIDNAFITGDAAGLATRDMVEGIGPAVRSGILAADAIAGLAEYDLASVDSYSLAGSVPRHVLEFFLIRRGHGKR